MFLQTKGLQDRGFRKIILNMSEKENIAIAITRMEKLLASISIKIQKSIEKCNAKNSPLVQEIIDLFELFKESVVARMKKTPEIERVYAVNLRECRTKIAELLLELEGLQNTFDEQKSNSEIFLKDMAAHVNSEEELMRSVRETAEVEIPREVEDSILKMQTVREKEEARKKLLHSEIDSAKEKLYSITEFNSATEKKLFDTCAKIEQEYVGVLAKYDRDIGALHALKEKLSQDNETVKTEKKNMEDQLAVQRVLYIRLRNEREIALMKAFTENLELYRRNRAAKIIQRTWRSYFERISQKKRRKARRK